jgi:hypothetical protein
MYSVRHKAFLGLQLLVFDQDLRHAGTISEHRVSKKGLYITFYTERGEYRFHNMGPKSPKRLANGDIKYLGTKVPWAYVRQD